jgi:hypothetical protein
MKGLLFTLCFTLLATGIAQAACKPVLVSMTGASEATYTCHNQQAGSKTLSCHLALPIVSAGKQYDVRYFDQVVLSVKRAFVEQSKQLDIKPTPKGDVTFTIDPPGGGPFEVDCSLQ